MAALEEEISGIVDALAPRTTVREGLRDYHSGSFHGVPVVIVLARVGKVAASATSTQLILRHQVREIVFTGVAGAVAHGLKVGDIVVGRDFWQHDLDARPLFPRHEIPLLGRAVLQADPESHRRLLGAARSFVASGLPGLELEDRDEFGLHEVKVVTGGIASGDQFFRSKEAVDELRDRLPGVACVEMEGAAVAQVCHEYGIPFSVVRTISDSADEKAHVDFPRFIQRVASRYSAGILRSLLDDQAAGNSP
jgi:adenosylhomocysteine nucleosidase